MQIKKAEDWIVMQLFYWLFPCPFILHT